MSFLGMGEGTFTRCGVIFRSCGAAWLFVASACCAQPIQSPRLLPNGQLAPLATDDMRTARTVSSTAPKHPTDMQGEKAAGEMNPSDSRAQPATLSLRNGQLKVEANNSDLTQILRDLAYLSGMTINGLQNGPRVFGTYGPGNSREILANLLVGSGYNFMMVGAGTDGATPRELFLTPKNYSSAIVSSNPRAVSESDDSDQPVVKANTNPADALGPGAIRPAPSTNDQDDNVRTQQNLQRLQHQQEQQRKAPQ